MRACANVEMICDVHIDKANKLLSSVTSSVTVPTATRDLLSTAKTSLIRLWQERWDTSKNSAELHCLSPRIPSSRSHIFGTHAFGESFSQAGYALDTAGRQLFIEARNGCERCVQTLYNYGGVDSVAHFFKCKANKPYTCSTKVIQDFLRNFKIKQTKHTMSKVLDINLDLGLQVQIGNWLIISTTLLDLFFCDNGGAQGGL